MDVVSRCRCRATVFPISFFRSTTPYPWGLPRNPRYNFREIHGSEYLSGLLTLTVLVVMVLFLLAPWSELDCRTTPVARWPGRRPSAVTAVVLHRRDGRSGGASFIVLVCHTMVLFYETLITSSLVELDCRTTSLARWPGRSLKA